MQDSYTLKPTNIVLDVNKEFPKIKTSDGKMGIFISGGMESTLIALMAIELYGKDKVICFYSDNIFSANDAKRNHYIVANVLRTADLINVDPVYVDFDYEYHISNKKQSIEDKISVLKEQYNVEFIMMGFTKLFFEVEVFKQEGLTQEQIKQIAYNDPIKYKSTIEEFHLDTGEYTWTLLEIDIPAEVYPQLRETSGFIFSPFQHLNKCEVVDLYDQLGKLDILYKTSSCITDSLTRVGMHCGECFNCQQRWDAFKILGTGIEDKTDYYSNIVKIRREHLENIRASKTR